MTDLWPADDHEEIEAQFAEQHWLSELMVLATRKAWVTQQEIDRALGVRPDSGIPHPR